MRLSRQIALLTSALFLQGVAVHVVAAPLEDRVDRSPVDLVVAHDNTWLATANQTSNSVSLVRVSDAAIVDEIKVGRRPAAIALHPDGQRLLVTGSHSGKLSVLRVADERLTKVATIEVGFDPHGVAVSPDGQFAYVACTADAKVAIVDLNIGHVQVTRDGTYAYFPWVVYRRNPITAGNIRLGWVLATRIARVRLDGPARREAMSLDPQGKAIADPHGLALTSDEQRLVVSASGTHELLVYRATDLPLKDYGGTDHVPQEVLDDSDRFFRVELGGRPMGLRIGNEDRKVYVANYLENSVQVVDLQSRRLVRSIPLGSASEPSLARRGESIFYDGRRSLDQWYSCHTCHYEGGANSVAIDTLNDDTRFTFKTVLPLDNVTQTAPWTWHGWQKDLRAAMKKSITTTMLGPAPSKTDVDALIAYLKTRKPPRSPFRQRDGSLTENSQRGRAIFESAAANCTACHTGPNFTDGEIHDVGTGKPTDRYQGFNTPSLIGVYRRVTLLHDGRVNSMEQLLAGPHSPNKVSGTHDLSSSELHDLVAFLRSL